MSTGRQILKNVGALTAARGVTAILTLVTTIYLARVLAPSAYGILSWSLAYFSYFALLPDLGLGVLGTREVARDPARTPHLVSHILGMRALLAVLALGLFLLVLGGLDKPLPFKSVVAVQGLGLLGIAVALDWVYQGVERMGVLAVRNVVVAVCTLAGILILVQRPDQVVLAAAAMVTALVVGNGWVLLTYRRDFGRVRPHFDWSVWRTLLAPALPIAAVHGLAAINANMDQLMLGLIRSEAEVGWYAAAYRLLLAALIPSQILQQAFLPSLSKASGDPEAMRAQGRMFAASLFAFGLPIGAAGVVLAPDLIALFGASYAPAAPALAILMVHLILMYVDLALGNPLVAWDRQRFYMYAFIGGAAANVVLNLALIPRYGVEGAAFATLASEGVVFVGVLYFHYQVVRQVYAGLFIRALGATALAVGSAASLRALLDLSAISTAILIAGLYAVLAPALRVVDLAGLRRSLFARSE